MGKHLEFILLSDSAVKEWQGDGKVDTVEGSENCPKKQKTGKYMIKTKITEKHRSNYKKAW